MMKNPYAGTGQMPGAGFPMSGGAIPGIGAGQMPGAGFPMGGGVIPGMPFGGGAGAGGGFPQFAQPMPFKAQSGQVPPPAPSGAAMLPTGTVIPSPAGSEQSYIENILRLNLGKMATVYMTFENNSEWNAKVFRGAVEAAGRDHIILSDPQTGRRYLLQMVNLDYITFDEPLNYAYPFGTPGQTGR